MAYNFSPKIVTDGLVLYLDAANTRSYVSGSTVWNDLSRNGYNGVLTNGPTFNSSNGGSIVFDGTNDYVNLSSYANNSLWNGLWPTGLSFSTTIKLASPLPLISDGRSIFVRGSGGAGNNYFNFSLQSNRQLRFWIGDYVPAFTTTLLNVSLIYHVILTWDKSNVRFYVNGILDSTTINTNILTNNTAAVLNLGSAIGAFSGWEFPGSIYNFSVYNRALSATEIQQNYNTTKTRFGL
jgi:hypothetical protein